MQLPVSITNSVVVNLPEFQAACEFPIGGPNCSVYLVIKLMINVCGVLPVVHLRGHNLVRFMAKLGDLLKVTGELETIPADFGQESGVHSLQPASQPIAVHTNSKINNVGIQQCLS